MVRVLRSFAVILLTIAMSKETAAQKITNATYPLYATAMELDTDRVTYAKHHITLQIDSTWEADKLVEWQTAAYAANGNILNRHIYPQDKPGTETVIEYTYNSRNICTYTTHVTLLYGDTTYMLEKRSIRLDTTRGIYVFETRVSYTEGKADTTYSDFEWDYIDTKCKTTWSRLYVNRTLNYVVQRPGSDTIRWTVYSMHDEDTLEKRIMTFGSNMYDIDTVYHYLSPEVMARAVYVNNRSTETRAWENGKLIEYFVYDDSVYNDRVWRSTIYNMLKNDSVPEIIIFMSDTLNVVRKNGINVFEDHTPDTVWYLPIPPPAPPEPTYENIFPYRKAVPMGNGMTRFEYYNFYAGTIKPLLVIIRDDRGVVHNYYYGNMVWKRVVK